MYMAARDSSTYKPQALSDSYVPYFLRNGSKKNLNR